MTALSKMRRVLILASFVTLCAAALAQAQDYEWLESFEYDSIFVFTDFNGCEPLEEKLNQTITRTFSRSNITATISKSFIFKTTGGSGDSVYELVDEELTDNNKIILYIYGKCIRYSPGFIYQFDISFGVNNPEISQPLLYTTPRHSVVGVDSFMGIDRTFRKLMRNAVNDYWLVNQGKPGNGTHSRNGMRSSR